MSARGLRNNNPGNIRLSATTRWQGEVRPSQDKSFCQFQSMAYGYRAQLKLLQNYIRKHDRITVEEILARYAPVNENNTRAYIDSVCRQMGGIYSKMYVINPESKAVMCALVAAMSRVENGVPAVMADVEAGWNLL